jgi:hypothetical protein
MNAHTSHCDLPSFVGLGLVNHCMNLDAKIVSRRYCACMSSGTGRRTGNGVSQTMSKTMSTATGRITGKTKIYHIGLSACPGVDARQTSVGRRQDQYTVQTCADMWNSSASGTSVDLPLWGTMYHHALCIMISVLWPPWSRLEFDVQASPQGPCLNRATDSFPGQALGGLSQHARRGSSHSPSFKVLAPGAVLRYNTLYLDLFRTDRSPAGGDHNRESRQDLWRSTPRFSHHSWVNTCKSSSVSLDELGSVVATA